MDLALRNVEFFLRSSKRFPMCLSVLSEFESPKKLPQLPIRDWGNGKRWQAGGLRTRIFYGVSQIYVTPPPSPPPGPLSCSLDGVEGVEGLADARILQKTG
jgi:hypothetical protein